MLDSRFLGKDFQTWLVVHSSDVSCCLLKCCCASGVTSPALFLVCVWHWFHVLFIAHSWCAQGISLSSECCCVLRNFTLLFSTAPPCLALPITLFKPEHLDSPCSPGQCLCCSPPQSCVWTNVPAQGLAQAVPAPLSLGGFCLTDTLHWVTPLGLPLLVV